MPGSASIGPNLVDDLLSTVDDLRGSLHSDMGVRQWRVYVISRTWSGGEIGEGTFTDSELEITPQPLIREPGELTRVIYRTIQAGELEVGEIEVSEVSLTYTEDELRPPYVAGTETLYCLRDAHGQSIAPRYYKLSEPPKSDRVVTIGWVLRMRIVAVDGVCTP